jgi:hypothetical protein
VQWRRTFVRDFVVHVTDSLFSGLLFSSLIRLDIVEPFFVPVFPEVVPSQEVQQPVAGRGFQFSPHHRSPTIPRPLRDTNVSVVHRMGVVLGHGFIEALCGPRRTLRQLEHQPPLERGVEDEQRLRVVFL